MASMSGSIDEEAHKQKTMMNPPCNKPTFVDYSNKNNFPCSAEVKVLYDAVVAHGRRTSRGQTTDNSLVIVNYDNFHVTLQELSNSMMPYASLLNSVVEIGLESIMLRTDKRQKKVVMPLNVAVHN